MSYLTCCISGLELTRDVFWFLLVENTKKSWTENRCWTPRTWPIEAKWDYEFSIQPPDETKVLVQAIRAGLNEDIVGRATDFAELLTAIQKKQVYVHENAFYPILNPFEAETMLRSDSAVIGQPTPLRQLKVEATFIRKDVWKKLVETRIYGVSSLARYRQEVQSALDYYQTLLEQTKERKHTDETDLKFEIYYRWASWRYHIESHCSCAALLTAEVANFDHTKGTLTTHSEIIRQLNGWDQKFVRTVAEFSRICDIMRCTNRVWGPSIEAHFSVDPRSEATVFSALASIANKDGRQVRKAEKEP